MQVIEKILKKIEDQPVSISQWMVGFVGIIYIRFLLESLSSRTVSGLALTDPFTLIHFGLFFLVVALGIISVLAYFSKNYNGAPKLVLFALPIIWFGPLFDIITKNKVTYEYISDTHLKLFFDFIKFFSTSPIKGASFGLRLEILLIVLGIGWYVWIRRKKIYLSFTAIFISFILIFLTCSIPGVINTFAHINSGDNSVYIKTGDYIAEIMAKSNIVHNTYRETFASLPTYRILELQFNKLLTQILFIISCLFGTIWFWKTQKQKFLIILKNSRPERIAFYLSLLFFGMGIAFINGYGVLNSYVDILSIICLCFAWVGVWMYAIHVNDITDVETDKISNSNRPIVQKQITHEEMTQTGYIWLVVALLGSWSAGFYPFFMVSVFIATSYIYSVPPLRLKRIPILSSFLISIACLVTVLAGFFFVSFDKKIEAFPSLFAIGIVIVFTLAINIKDMKDVGGDTIDEVNTLPTLFKKNGAKIVGSCLALSFLLVPIFLSIYTLYIFAIPASIIGFKLVTKKPYKEKLIFILYFAFLASIVLLYFGIYWLSSTYTI